MHFSALLEIACGSLKLNGIPERAATVLADDLLAAFTLDTRLVEFVSVAPKFVTEPGARPEMCPVARRQVKASRIVSNRRHEQVELDAVSARLAPFMDGNHDRESLLGVLALEPVPRRQEGLPGGFEAPESNAPTPADLDAILVQIGRAHV